MMIIVTLMIMIAMMIMMTMMIMMILMITTADGSWYKLMKANWERAWRIKVATTKVISKHDNDDLDIIVTPHISQLRQSRRRECKNVEVRGVFFPH